ncbi:LysE family translocator [Acidisphaera sp. L21]|uniref:LysE family translocator n=1 Tax=Acidisphaera sp. L21 TaxID=1641851 RepID=UPI00131E13B7|nr:LysE family transporter [Acidisphaera sp. L21]
MTTDHVSLAAGLVVGFSIAVPIGPMGLLCIQRTLVAGMRVGVSTGLGAVTVNVAYGALILLGLGTVAPVLAEFGRALGVAGGLFLLWSALRMMRQQRQAVACEAALTPLAAYASAVAFNATNPISPLRMVALLSPIVAGAAPAWSGVATLLAGMFAAAAIWWICLSFFVALLRTRLTPAMLTAVNRFAAAGLTLYGAWTLARSLGS